MASVNQDKADASKPETSRGRRQGPIIVDLGKQKRKKIRRLRKGKGPLFAKVMDTHDELRSQGVYDDSAGPMIVLVKEKKQKRRGQRYGSIFGS
jgi:hypothetical protein